VLDLVEGRDRHEPLLRKFGKALEGILPGEARLAGGAFGRAEARVAARATELGAVLNRVRATKNPIGLASGFDEAGREVTYVA
jgi:hypothetical protein